MRISSTWLILLLMSSGCATRVTPPLHVKNPVTVYLTDYGRHSSILLPAGDGYVEYAYGDWEWFALGHTQWWLAIQAMLYSPKATLGERYIAIQHGEINVDDFADWQRLNEFQVDKDRAESLRMTLEAIFHRGNTKPVQSDYSGLEHVTFADRYWLFHNCNHATAEWLRDLGCKIDGPALLSNFEMDIPED